MKSIIIALEIEALKIRKSKVFWLIFILFGFIPCMMGLMMFVQKYPEFAAKLGLIGTKASMLRFGEVSWKNYFNLLNQSNAAIGLIGYGFVTTWIFGREYSDHTVKDLLALPISRVHIVIAKFLSAFTWCIIISCEFYLVAFLLGLAIDLPGFSGEILLQSTSIYAVSSFLTLLLCTPVAFFASYGRGYLLSLGIIILTLIMANLTGLLGIGPWFPWAIPGIYTVQNGTEGMQLVPASYLILVITSLIGFLGTLGRWVYADQK